MGLFRHRINVNDKDQLNALRDLLKDELAFPFADLSANDEFSHIVIQIVTKKPEDNWSSVSKEFDESINGKLSYDLRKKLFEEMGKSNVDPEIHEKLEKLGIQIVYGPKMNQHK